MIISPDIYISPFSFPLIPYLYQGVQKLQPRTINVPKKHGCPPQSQEQRKATFKAKRFNTYKDAIKHFPNYRATSQQIAGYLGYNLTSIASILKATVEEFPDNFYKCGELKHQMNSRNTCIWAFKEVHQEQVINNPYVLDTVNREGRKK